jgi:hypothetical protein
VDGGGTVRGVLLWTFAEPRPFDPAEREVLVALASQCAQALERARLHAAEAAARRAAEAANRAKSEFLATMSHELRTPLNAIGGYTELIELGIHGPITDAQRDGPRAHPAQPAHLLGLINDVLNYAKLEAGRVAYASPGGAGRRARRPRPDDRAAARRPAARVRRARARRRHRACRRREAAAGAAQPAVQRGEVHRAGRARGACASTDGAADVVRVRCTTPGVGHRARDQLGASSSRSCRWTRGSRARTRASGWGWRSAATWRAAWAATSPPRARVGVGSTFTLTLPRA